MFLLPIQRYVLILVFPPFLLLKCACAQSFSWPAGKRMALSISFDDARNSQVEGGTALLDRYGVKATFYVQPGPVRERLEGWKKAVAQDHEIGNHTLVHPCSGNFPWARDKALEDYSLKQMRKELRSANRQIKELLGVTPNSFAYPCGQNFVGRGRHTRSFVPLVADLFSSGRGWLDEAPNAPAYCDLAQLMGVEMDGKEFAELLPLIESARQQGAWLVLGGHEMNTDGFQTTRLHMLEELIRYAQRPESGIWLATVGEVTAFVKQQRAEK